MASQEGRRVGLCDGKCRRSGVIASCFITMLGSLLYLTVVILTSSDR